MTIDENILEMDKDLVGWDRFGRKVYVGDYIAALPIDEKGFGNGYVTGHVFEDGIHYVTTDNPKIGKVLFEHAMVNIEDSPYREYRCVYDKNGERIHVGDTIYTAGNEWRVIDISADEVAYEPVEHYDGWPYDNLPPTIKASLVTKV